MSRPPAPYRRRARPYRDTTKPHDPEQCKALIRSHNERIADIERQIDRLKRDIEDQNRQIRREQYRIWRAEQSIEDNEGVTDRELKEDELFRIRFPNEKTV